MSTIFSKIVSQLSRFSHDLLDKGDKISKAKEALRQTDASLQAASDRFVDAAAELATLTNRRDQIDVENAALMMSAKRCAERNTTSSDELAAEFLKEIDKNKAELARLDPLINSGKEFLSKLEEKLRVAKEERDRMQLDISTLTSSHNINKAREAIAENAGGVTGVSALEEISADIKRESYRVDALEKLSGTGTETLQKRMEKAEPVVPMAERIAALR